MKQSKACAMTRTSVVQAIACVVLGTGLVSVADAAPKYNRKTIDVDVASERAIEEVKPDENMKRKDSARPEITADQFFQIEGEVANIRSAQIQEYLNLIRDTSDNDPEKPDLYFRLAELFAQKQRYQHFRAMELYNKIDQAGSQGEKNKLKSQQQKYFDAEKKELLNAVKVYKAIADNPKFRKYKRMDEALFYYAYTLQQAKYPDQARMIFKRLIKDYPNSRFIPDAYLAFAEYYFQQGNLSSAEKFYDKVLEFPKASIYNYALYMKGWVYYNQGNPKDSLETWYEVATRTKGKEKEKDLNRAAKKDFVRAYADVGSADKAYAAFKRVDNDFAFEMLGFLGEYYLAQGKARKTMYIYQQMMRERPKDERICDWQYTVVRAAMTVGDNEEKIQESERLAKLYRYLADNKAVPEQMLTECRDNATDTLGWLAKVWHVEGLKTLNYDILQNSDRLYRAYLTYFPDAKDAPEMQMFYAELLWKRAEGEQNPSKAGIVWEDAAKEYTKVVELSKNEQHVKEAAYAAVLAWKNALAVDPSTGAPDVDPEKQGGKAEKPQEIPDKEKKMIDAFDVYIKYVKDQKDDELVVIKFLKGRIFWKYRHYAEAAPFFIDVIQTRPEHEVAEFSANLLLDSLNRSGQQEELVKWVDRLLANKAFLEDRPDMQERLSELKCQSTRMLAQTREKAQDYQMCGNTYVETFRQCPEYEKLDEVLFNAAVCYEKARLLGQAIYWRSQLVSRFPKSNLAQKAGYALGQNYAAIAAYDRAADKYEEYAKKYGGEKNASDALNDATFFRKGLGDDKKAIELTEFYIKQYGRKQPKDAADAFWSIAAIYEKRGNERQLLKHLEDYLKQWGRRGGADRQVIAHARIGQVLWEQSCPLKDTVGGACIKVQRQRALKVRRRGKRTTLQTQCGPQSKSQIVVAKRNPARVKEAQKHFQTALNLYKKARKNVGGDDEADKQLRQAQMTYWAAAAQFYLGEEKYEDFLGLQFPGALDFDDRKKQVYERSEKKLKDWIKGKEKALVDAEKTYMTIVNDMKGAGRERWAIAAASRVGKLFQNYSDAYFTATIPKQLQKEQYLVDAYCDKLLELADPLEAKSIKAFSFCLDEATQLNWSNEWSQLCEAELAQIRPQDFPAANELRAMPNSVPILLAIEPVIPELRYGADDTASQAAETGGTR